jgi:hypothetical protein
LACGPVVRLHRQRLVTLLESRKGEQSLDYRGHVAAVAGVIDSVDEKMQGGLVPIPEIRESGETGAKDRFKRPPVVACQREVEFEILLDLLKG